MAHHHHQIGLDLLRGTGWETEAPHGAQLDINGLGLIDPQPQPSVPWSWPLRGVTGRGHTILDSLVVFPCPGLSLAHPEGWVCTLVDRVFLVSQGTRSVEASLPEARSSPTPVLLMGAGGQGSQSCGLAEGGGYKDGAWLDCLFLTLVPSQTTPTFCSFSQGV